jgi:hypothetical protein
MLLKMTYLRVQDDEADENAVTYKRRCEACEFLLLMDSGEWSGDKVVHHCKYGCCKNIAETRLKLWVAVQARC